MYIARHISKPTECLRSLFVPIPRLLPTTPRDYQQTRLLQNGPPQPSLPSRPRDESITSRLVQLVSPDTGRILPPEPPSQILARMDRKKFFLVQVSGPEIPDAVCKIMPKQEAREYEKRKVSLSRREESPKELELNFSIASNDLKRKMDLLKGFLEEGKQVIVRIKRAKKWVVPSPEEVGILKDYIAKVVETVVGTKDYKDREEFKAWEGQIMMACYYLRGPTKKQNKVAGPDGKGSRRTEREQEMEDKKEKRKKRAQERKGLLQNASEANV
ncbi:hypothetical protein MMC07_001198 [Pseudocyphellaria aurata]|nr:hypothetical protein [Pseudocyphellaria aurata]